jgi:hypothetical protein
MNQALSNSMLKRDWRPWARALVFGLMRLRRFSQNGYYELALGIIARSVSLRDEIADFKSRCGMGGLAPPRRRTGLRNIPSFGHVSSRPLPHVLVSRDVTHLPRAVLQATNQTPAPRFEAPPAWSDGTTALLPLPHLNFSPKSRAPCRKTDSPS